MIPNSISNHSQVDVKYCGSYHFKSESVVLDMQYNFDGSLLAIAYCSGDLCIYDLIQQSRKTPMLCFKDNKGGILKLSWSLPQLGRYLASSSIDKVINIYDFNHESTLKPKTIQLPCIPVCLAFCPWDERLVLAVGLSNGHLLIYDEKFEEPKENIEAHEMSINCISWENQIVVSNQRVEWVKKSITNMEAYIASDNVPLLASVSSDKFMHIWRIDLKTLKLESICKLQAHQKQIRQVNWKPNLFIGKVKTLVTCSDDCKIKLWDLDTNNELKLRSTTTLPGTVWRVQWNPLGTMLAVCITNEQQQLETRLYIEDSSGTLTQTSKIN